MPGLHTKNYFLLLNKGTLTPETPIGRRGLIRGMETQMLARPWAVSNRSIGKNVTKKPIKVKDGENFAFRL